MKSLTIAVDMFGCPNRCRHCWLSHMPNRKMEEGADEWIVNSFKPYFLAGFASRTIVRITDNVGRGTSSCLLIPCRAVLNWGASGIS